MNCLLLAPLPQPENVLFAADGTVKLADFGLAINMVEERPVSRVGTLDYMAPGGCRDWGHCTQISQRKRWLWVRRAEG